MAEFERRSTKRVPFPCEVESTGAGGNALNPKISDLSVSGAFLDSVTELPPGTVVTLKFRLPTGALVVVNAEVVHAMPRFGWGVRFLDLAEEYREAIAQVVEHARRLA
jgi:PilZ domain-containing protein